MEWNKLSQMFCFKENLGSARGAQLTAQEGKNDSLPPVTRTVWYHNSLAATQAQGGDQEKLKEISASSSDLSDEHLHRDQSDSKQRETAKIIS